MSLKVCKFYKYNRNCRFGESCRYSHTINQEPKFLPPCQISQHDHDGAVSSNQQQNLLCCNTTGTSSHKKNNNEISVTAPTNQTEDSLAATYLINSETETQNYAVPLKIPDLNNIQLIEQPNNKKVCQYFIKHGRCAFGRNCRFMHIDVLAAASQEPKNSGKKNVAPRFQRIEKQNLIENNFENKDGKDKTFSIPYEEETCLNNVTGIDGKNATKNDKSNKKLVSERFCRFFKSGFCRKGNKCEFSHSLKPKDRYLHEEFEGSGNNDEPQHIEKNQNIQLKPRVFRPQRGLQQIITLSEIETNGTEKYRMFDINYLKRRFADCTSSKETPVNEGEDFIFELAFEPSDPDWPFDVKSFELQVKLSKMYPKELMIVEVPFDKQDLPESVRRYLEVSFEEWLAERKGNLKEDMIELMARPFFKWLDRNFEDVMTDALKQLKRELAAKAAGLEFISADQLKAKYNVSHLQAEENSGSEADGNILSEDEESSDKCLDSQSEGSCMSDEEKVKDQISLSLDAERKGTEIKLRSLQLKQNTTSIMFEQLRLILQCSRCKNHAELTVSKGKAKSLRCDKCSYEMLILYRPSLAHQFSSIIGFLDLDNCQAFDLIFQDCDIIVSCLSCSKTTKINGMVSGQMMDSWCNACNARLRFACETVKFYQLEQSSVNTDKVHVEVIAPKKKKPPKDLAIREGYPLPDFGTCRHYKQSYRWLRFPCCGKAYPCDVCHDNKEDHEMIFANRMICGHCCKEQNFSTKQACTSCSQNMTKVRSAHWEGGTGCRDKISMSRNDQQKFKNMNKTVSRKKVQSAGSKKKSTKLRHA